MAIPAVARWRAARGRTVSAHLVDGALLERHAYMSFDLLRRHAQSVRGLRLAELGPGDVLGLGLLALGAGAASYSAVDRFAGAVGSERAKAFYRALEADCAVRHPEVFEELRRRKVQATHFPEGHAELVEYLNCAVEDLGGRAPRAFDVVFSNNVLEHVFDIERTARSLYECLAPGGRSIHRIDFGPHDRWVHRPDPLEWLRVPAPLWTLMGSQRGTPNRKRSHEFEAAFRTAGFAVEVTPLERFPAHAVETLRRESPRRFGRMPLESLSTKTALFLLKKPS